MIMNKYNFLTISIFLLFSINLSAKDIQVEINGTLTNAENRILYLQTFKENRNLTLDSIKLDKKGKFTFKTMVSEINFYWLLCFM